MVHIPPLSAGWVVADLFRDRTRGRRGCKVKRTVEGMVSSLRSLSPRETKYYALNVTRGTKAKAGGSGELEWMGGA